jgi:replicative DNA helicase
MSQCAAAAGPRGRGALRLQRETTDSAVLGVPTGAAQLDSLLGCFTTGLDLLAGPPGMGKTTLGRVVN